MSYVNDRFKQAQTGSMRINIHRNHRVNMLSPDESLNILSFHMKAGKANGIQFIQAKVEKDSIINTATGEKLVRFDDVRIRDGNCEMDFNPQGSDLATLTEQNFENNCCISVTMDLAKAHFCIKSAFRCEYDTNRFMKTAIFKCKNFKDAQEKHKR